MSCLRLVFSAQKKRFLFLQMTIQIGKAQAWVLGKMIRQLPAKPSQHGFGRTRSAIQKDVFACSTDSKRRGINKTIYKYVSPECGVFERLFNSCPVNIFRYLVVARLQLDTVKFEMANGTSLMKKRA